MSDPIIIIRIPQSSWRGIVNGIEKWSGRSADDIEILSDFEVVASPGPARVPVVANARQDIPFLLAALESAESRATAAEARIAALAETMPYHRETKLHGFHRGILGGMNCDCVCGAHWVDHDGVEKWQCPREAILLAAALSQEGTEPSA